MSESPGWEGIHAALKPVYGDREPKQYGPVLPFIAGSGDPLEGINVYDNGDHWHYVTLGFTELHEKTSEDKDVSGFGIELTFRLRRGEETDPPRWVLSFLQNLARYVFETGNVFQVGHHMNLNGPIAIDEKTAITAVVFANDPDFGEISSLNGTAGFVHVVGITGDELDTVEDWNSESFAEMLMRSSSTLVPDLSRTSLLQQADVAAEIRKRVEQEGSSTGASFFQSLSWEAAETAMVTLGATAVKAVQRALNGRIPHGRPYILQGREQLVRLVPGKAGWRVHDGDLEISMSPELTDAMQATLTPKRGLVGWKELPGLDFQILPTRITDRQGNVIKVIG